MSEGYAFKQLLRKTQSQFTRLDQQHYFWNKFLVLKFLFCELQLEHFYASLGLKKLLFRVRQNNSSFFEFEFKFKFAALFSMMSWLHC